MNTQELYPLSEISQQVWEEQDKYKIQCLQGAVRSSKSFTANIIFLNKLKNKKGNVLISGFSADSAKKNILPELEELLNVEFEGHNSTKGEYFSIPLKEFRHIKLYVKGAGKNGDEKKIQGITLLGWLADEVATYSKPFFDMTLTRLSMSNSFAIWTLNPESPSHWLKKWLDKQEEIKDNKYIKNYYYKLDDNLSLTEEYKNELKTSFSGHFYDRMVLGKWAVGEGLIFNIDKVKFVKQQDIQKKFSNIPKFLYEDYVAIDFGTTNYTSFLHIRKHIPKEIYIDEEKDNERYAEYYIIKEFYKNKLSPSQYVKELEEFIKDINVIQIIIDPASAHFKQEVKQSEYIMKKTELRSAKNDVKKGILLTQRFIENGLLTISEECKNLKDELGGYSWDEKKIDTPIKENDHAVDAMRYGIFTTSSFTYESL